MNNTQALPISDSHNPEPDSISADPVIEGVDKLSDWLEHREIVIQELCPVGALETLYAQRAALNLWRLNRVIGFEIEARIGEIEAGAGKSLEDSQESRLNRDSPDQASLQTLIKYEAHLHRCLAGTMAELRRLQKERRQGLRDVNPAGRVADRAGGCQHQQIKDGSPGGSPSHKSSPSLQITNLEMSIPAGRGADRAGGCEHQQIKDGSPGDEPSRNGSPSQIGSPIQNGSASQKTSPMQMESPMRTGSGKHRNSASRKHAASNRASPIPKPPPLLESITNRRRLEEYTRGEIFERNLASATLDFAMIPCR